ncbi:hypothetical protein [Ostreiculturibacter nitratireducens]|uniref:Flp family type IVb pilin n=1 Tax=Ostreiculturibacter nitratireducens TaxID=3075226 RepID=UPI0031B5BCAA
MKLFKFVGKFRKEEDGAVTVDWVVLTAAVIALGVIALTAVRGGVQILSGKISSALSSRNPDSP